VRLIAETYKPDVVPSSVSGHFSMGLHDEAIVVRDMIKGEVRQLDSMPRLPATARIQ
jgi:hypothetical protein